MLWAFIFLLVIAVLGGYFILHMPLLPLILMVGLGGCLLAFFIFGKMEKDTEEKIEKIIKKK